MAESSSPPPAQTNTARNPPPQLFQAPPTNASSSASPTSSVPSSSNPPHHQQQVQQQQHGPPLTHTRTARGGIPTLTRTAPQVGEATSNAAGRASAEDNRVDALWAKMQLTLEEVELSALSSTHVFGNAHSTALEDLREAQIALAKAWGRGDTDDEFAAMDAAWEEGADGAATSSDTGATEGDGTKRSVEDSGEIVEARRRREANERFFKKVEDGVTDVVGKLNEVAAAMAKVEKESREIWDERDSAEGSSVAS